MWRETPTVQDGRHAPYYGPIKGPSLENSKRNAAATTVGGFACPEEVHIAAHQLWSSNVAVWLVSVVAFQRRAMIVISLSLVGNEPGDRPVNISTNTTRGAVEEFIFRYKKQFMASKLRIHHYNVLCALCFASGASIPGLFRGSWVEYLEVASIV